MKSFVLSVALGRRSAFAVLTLLFLLSNMGILPAQVSPTGRPYWWDSRGAVLAPEPAAGQGNNSAVAAAGQAMHIVQEARAAMMLTYGTRYAVDQHGAGQYGAGVDIDKLITDYDRALAREKDTIPREEDRTLKNRALRLGQLKYLAAPFWQRLNDFGAIQNNQAQPNPNHPFPWTNSTDNDNALVTIGQLKKAFSFPVGPTAVPYQDTVFCDVPQVTEPGFTTGTAWKTNYGYVWEDFDRPTENSSKGSANSITWRQTGVIGSESAFSGIIGRSALRAKSQPYGQVKKADGLTPVDLGAQSGFVRLAATPDSKVPLSSLELNFPLPQGAQNLYIQYRWRAFPDMANRPLKSAMPVLTPAELEAHPGLLLFGERQPPSAGSEWTTWNGLGWERYPMLIDRGRGNQYSWECVGAFDAAVPVLSAKRWTSDPDERMFDFLPERLDGVAGESDGVFSVLAKAQLPLGFPSVAGPGWRLTTIRINLQPTGDDQPKDAMDIWLDGRALGRNYGQPVEYKGKTFVSPVADARYDLANHQVGLRWNGLRGANFDLGAIYVGSQNPLFKDVDHDGIPLTDGSMYHASAAGAQWMAPPASPNGTPISKFIEDTNSSIYDRAGVDPRPVDPGTTPDYRWFTQIFTSWGSYYAAYHKVDIARHLQNWKYLEQTLPNPFSPEGSTKNWKLFASSPPLEDWSSSIDSDRDGLPDNWEARWFSNSLAQTAEGDPDGDGMTNIQEYHLGQNPIRVVSNPDVDGDTLDNAWELLNGYNPFDGVSQRYDDPDQDGFTNEMERALNTDPLVANSGGTYTGAPRGVSFGASTHYPEPPPTNGTNLNQWLSEPDGDPETSGRLGPGDDADSDGVSNFQDAVPYDPNLTFPPAPEAQYIAIPLTESDGTTPVTGVPVAINNLGHILLVPPPPMGKKSWTELAGIGPSVQTNLDPRAPSLWKGIGQGSVPIPLPVMSTDSASIQFGFVPRWDHAGAKDSKSLDLDLERDTDLVLAHALWTSSAKDLPSTKKLKPRTPDLRGRHAFVWNAAVAPAGSAAQWLPWQVPTEIGGIEVPRFLTVSPIDYADCTSSVANQLLSGGRVTGRQLAIRQQLNLEGQLSESSQEDFNFFAWNTVTSTAVTLMSKVSGSRRYSKGESDEGMAQIQLFGRSGGTLRMVSRDHHAIIADIKGGQPGKDDSDDYSNQQTNRQKAAIAKRQPQVPLSAGYSFYFLDDLWGELTSSAPLLLPIQVGKGYQPQEMNHFAMEGKGSEGQPFSRGPLIIGSPGRYWTRSVNSIAEFATGWLYTSPGIEDLQNGYSANDRIPFEIGADAKINNQGVIICEDRLWRNGRGHNIKDLIGAGTGLSNFELHDINDSGVIAATAARGSSRVPVILVPVETEDPQEVIQGEYVWTLVQVPKGIIPQGIPVTLKITKGNQILDSAIQTFDSDGYAGIRVAPRIEDKPGDKLDLKLEIPSLGINRNLGQASEIISGPVADVQVVAAASGQVVCDDHGYVDVTVTAKDAKGNLVTDGTLLSFSGNGWDTARNIDGNVLTAEKKSDPIFRKDEDQENINPTFATINGNISFQMSVPLDASANFVVHAEDLITEFSLNYRGLAGTVLQPYSLSDNARLMRLRFPVSVADGTEVHWLTSRGLFGTAKYYTTQVVADPNPLNQGQSITELPLFGSGPDELSTVFAVCGKSVFMSLVDLQKTVSPTEPGAFTTYIQYPVISGTPVTSGDIVQNYSQTVTSRILSRYQGRGYAIGQTVNSMPDGTPISVGGSPINLFLPKGAIGLIRGAPGAQYRVQGGGSYIELIQPSGHTGTAWFNAASLQSVIVTADNNGIAEFAYRSKGAFPNTPYQGQGINTNVQNEVFTITHIGTNRAQNVSVAAADQHHVITVMGTMGAFFGLSDATNYAEFAASAAGGMIIIGDAGTMVKNLWRATPFSSKHVDVLETTITGFSLLSAAGFQPLKPLLSVLKPMAKLGGARRLVVVVADWIKDIVRKAGESMSEVTGAIASFMSSNGTGGLVYATISDASVFRRLTRGSGDLVDDAVKSANHADLRLAMANNSIYDTAWRESLDKTEALLVTLEKKAIDRATVQGDEFLAKLAQIKHPHGYDFAAALKNAGTEGAEAIAQLKLAVAKGVDTKIVSQIINNEGMFNSADEIVNFFKDLGAAAGKAADVAGQEAGKGGLNSLLRFMRSKKFRSTSTRVQGVRYELQLGSKYAKDSGVKSIDFRKFVGKPGQPDHTDLDLVLEMNDGLLTFVQAKKAASFPASVIEKERKYLMKILKQKEKSGFNGKQLREVVYEVGSQLSEAHEAALTAMFQTFNGRLNVRLVTPQTLFR